MKGTDAVKRKWPKGRNGATHCNACWHKFFVGEPRYRTTDRDHFWCQACKREADAGSGGCEMNEWLARISWLKGGHITIDSSESLAERR